MSRQSNYGLRIAYFRLSMREHWVRGICNLKSAIFGISILLALTAVAFAETPSQVNVLDFGAKGDGVTDDTPAFDAAMAAVTEKGGTVFIPVGKYLITTHLVVPKAVALEGVWKTPTSRMPEFGSTLLAVEGEGSEEGAPFIQLNSSSAIKGLMIFYPNQNPDDIKKYPWCVAGRGSQCSIIDCTLLNPYQAVDFGTKGAGRHYIRNLYGQPLRRGIFVDQCYDVGRIENVHFWPFWVWHGNAAIQKWLPANGEAFIFGRTDWEYVYNTFCYGYRVGYRFAATQHGSMNGNVLGIGADSTNIAVLVDNAVSYGLLITNGEFVSQRGDNPTEVVVKDTNTGVIQFHNCAFWGGAHQIARIGGSGTVTFNGCNFRYWDRYGRRAPAIETFGGNLMVQGCIFGIGAPQIALRGNTQSAIVMGNRMAGPLSVTNMANANLQIGLNAAKQPPVRPKEERGAIVVDDSDGPASVKFTGAWRWAENEEGYEVGYYRGTHWAQKGAGDCKAVFTPKVPKTSMYRVYVYVGADHGKDHAPDAPVEVHSADGVKTTRINLAQTKGGWVKLGTNRFLAGRKGSITFTNNAKGNVVADAVKLAPG